MAEPHASIVVGALAGGAASTATVFMGAQVDALVIGLMAATFVAIWLDTINSRVKAAAAVMFSAMLAGYGSPVAAEWVASTAPSVAENHDALRLFLALMIGAFSPTAVPIGIRYFGNKVNGGQA